MMDNRVQSTKCSWRITRQLAGVDQVLGHRYHLPIELVSFRAAVVVETGLLCFGETRNSQLTAACPIGLQRSVRFLPIPISEESHECLRLLTFIQFSADRTLLLKLRNGRSVKKSTHIFLPIRRGKPICVRVDHNMDPKPQ